MHAIRITIGTVLALALSGVSIICCFRFGMHLASGNDGVIYGTLGAVADGLKSLLPIGIAAALGAGQRARAITGMLLFLTFSVYSFCSELGLYALSRDAQSSTTMAGKESFELLKTERARIQDRLKALGQQRPTGTIKADIAAQHQNRLWTITLECKEATAPASRVFCADLEKLAGELASAEEAERLRTDDGKIAAKLSGMDLSTVLRSSDPQSEALGRFTGLAPSTMRDALAVLVAILIELGSGFGLWVATAAPRQAKDTPPRRQHPMEQRPATPKPRKRRTRKKQSDPVKMFLASCASDRLSNEATATELHAGYSVWANQQGQEALSPTALGRRLSALNAPKTKRGGTVRYQGVLLSPGNRLN